MVGGDESLIDDDPAGVLGSLNQQVCERRDRHIWLVGAVEQVCKQQCTFEGKRKYLNTNVSEPLASNMYLFFSLCDLISHENTIL